MPGEDTPESAVLDIPGSGGVVFFNDATQRGRLGTSSVSADMRMRLRRGLSICADVLKDRKSCNCLRILYPCGSAGAIRFPFVPQHLMRCEAVRPPLGTLGCSRKGFDRTKYDLAVIRVKWLYCNDFSLSPYPCTVSVCGHKSSLPGWPKACTRCLLPFYKHTYFSTV